MSLLYTGIIQWIDGRPCTVFALGTDHDDAFVQERQYAVSDNTVYIYDMEMTPGISWTWVKPARNALEYFSC